MELTDDEIEALVDFLREYGQLEPDEVYETEQRDVLKKIGYFEAP